MLVFIRYQILGVVLILSDREIYVLFTSLFYGQTLAHFPS